METIQKTTLATLKYTSRKIFGQKNSVKKIPPQKTEKKSFGSFSGAFKGLSNALSQGSLSVKEQTFLIKRLSFLITAGVPIVESLHMIREQTRSKRQGRVLDTVITDVSNGQALSSSLSKFKGMFSEFAINIINVGESTGILSQNLEYLADELKKKQALKRKIIGAFVYPVVVTAATIGITIFLIIYLFPKIMPVFESLHMKLPLSTRIVIAVSNGLQHHGLLIFGILVSCILALIISVKKSRFIHFCFDYLLFKIPLIGNMIQHYNLASSSRTLGLLLKGGITLSESLPIVVKTSRNLVYKKEFQALGVVVNRGEKMSAYLKTRRNLFPEVVSQITTVGERSGNLSNSLLYLSDLYEGEVDDFTKNLSSLIEPVMMIIMGILVGFIAISIITPIYSITQNLHG